MITLTKCYTGYPSKVGREGRIFKIWRRKKTCHCSGSPNLCVEVFQAKKGHSWQRARCTRGEGTRVHGTVPWQVLGNDVLCTGDTCLHTTEPGTKQEDLDSISARSFTLMYKGASRHLHPNFIKQSSEHFGLAQEKVCQ